MSKPKSLPERMKKDWNDRATEDALWYVVNYKGKGELTISELIEAGEVEMKNSLEPFVADRGLNPAVRVCLEIGCGVGRLTSGLAKRFSSLIATDVSTVMLKKAEEITKAQGLTNITFKALTGFNLEGISDGSVDFVYSCIVFQHIPDPELQYSYLEDVFRVLSPRGAFLLEFYVNAEDGARIKHGWEKRAAEGVAGDWGPDAQHELPRYETAMCTAVDPDRVREIINQHGYGITHDYAVGPDVWWIGGTYMPLAPSALI